MNSRHLLLIVILSANILGCSQLTSTKTDTSSPPVDTTQKDRVAASSEQASTLIKTEQTADEQKPQAKKIAPPRFPRSPKLSSDASALFEQLKKAISSHDHTNAHSLVDKLLIQYPKYSALHLNKALIYMDESNFLAASQRLTQCLKNECKDPRAYNLLGVCYRELGEFTNAEKAYTKAISMEPNYPAPHWNLAILAELYLGDFVAAKQSLQKFQALQIEENSQLQLWLADLELRIKEQNQ